MKKIIFISISLVGALFIIVLASTLTRTREERTARSLAKQEARNRGWTGFAIVKSVANENNRWVIQIERFPYEFGGHATVEILDGKVIKYRPGK